MRLFVVLDFFSDILKNIKFLIRKNIKILFVYYLMSVNSMDKIGKLVKKCIEI